MCFDASVVGSGKRPRKFMRYTGCKAQILACLNENGKVIVSSQCTQHNHRVDKKLWYEYSEHRQVQPEVQEEVRTLVEANSSFRNIREFVITRTREYSLYFTCVLF